MGLYARRIGPRVANALCAMKQIRRQRERVVPLAEGVVVELGLGGGRNLPLYDRGRVRKLIGVNPDDGFPDLLDLGRDGAGLEVEIVTGSAEALPFEDGFADTVVVTYTFCSIPDERAAMAEARRVLKPGGRLLVSEHGRAPDPRVARWQDRLNGTWRRVALGCNLNRDCQGALARAGFDASRLERFYLPRAPKVVGAHHLGAATPR